MNSYYHSKASAKKWGGTPEDYLPIHSFIDSSKRNIGDVRHRSMYHHTEGIFLCERIFGATITVGGPPQGGILMIPEELDLPNEIEFDEDGLDPITASLIESMKKTIKNPQISFPTLPSPIVVRSQEEADRLLRSRTVEVPVRLIAELHIMQDLGWIPSPSDYINNMELKTWMGGPTKSERNLSDMFPVRNEPMNYIDRRATPDPPPAPLIPDPNLLTDLITSSTKLTPKNKDRKK